MAEERVQFIINIDPHSLLGIQACVWIAPLFDEDVSLVDSRLSSGNFSGFGLATTDPLTILVAEAESYTEANVLAHFNRKTRVAKTLEEFQKDPVRKKALSQYVLRTVSSWMERAVATGYPLSSGLKRGEIIKSHLLYYLPIIEPPVLYFYRQSDGLRYQLRLSQSGKPLDLLGRKFQALAGASEWAIIDRWLIRLEDAPATLLKPFTEKAEIFISEKMIGEYMRTFILRIAERAEIIAEGFQITEHTIISGKRIGIIQDVFTNTFKCRLSFAYDDIWFHHHDTPISRQRLVETKEGDYSIHRYIRNISEEQQWAASLTSAGLQVSANGTLIFVDDADGLDLASAANWLVRHITLLEKSGWIAEPLHTPQGVLLPIQATLEEADPREGTDWFDIQARVIIGEHQLPFSALKRTIPDKIPFHPLPEGFCFLVPPAWFLTYTDWFLLGEIEGDAIRFTKAQHRAFQQHTTNEEAAYKPTESPGSQEHHPVPPGLQATLRPYQQSGFSWLAGLYGVGLGACLADDMGLGKTIQTIALLLHIRKGLQPAESIPSQGQLDIFAPLPSVQSTGPLHALIVAPSSLLFNWAAEIRRFAPDLRVWIHSGVDRHKQIEPLQTFDVLITSYALMVRDSLLFSKLQLRCVVLDESQHIKNKDSKTFHAVSVLRSPFRLTLTGTPVENSLADLWSQMHFINPGLLGTYEKFRTHYQRPIEKQNDLIKQDALRSLVRPYMLRRRKEEVAADLPELTEQLIYCDMTEAQADCYESEKNSVRSLMLGQMEKGKAIGAPLILNALMRLRQIAICPSILSEYSEISSGKTEVICAELETIVRSGHRALLFSAFLKHLKQYSDFLDTREFSYDTLTGEDSAREKKKAEDALQGEEISFLLLTLKAGGVGLNLTAADYVLLADPWWNPAVEKQAIARSHRIGQKKPVIAIRFITRGTIEEKIVRLQQRKQQWSDDLLEEGAFLSSLNDTELQELVD